VVHNHVASDVFWSPVGGYVTSCLANDGGHLKLEIQLVAHAGVGDRLIGTKERGSVGEVKDRTLVPLRNHTNATASTCRLYMLLKGVEVAQGWRIWNRGTQSDGIAGMCEVGLGMAIIRAGSLP